MEDTYKRAEHQKWHRRKKPLVDDRNKAIENELDSIAERGYSELPGETVWKILNIDKVTKDKLTDSVGELYSEQKQILFQILEFTYNLAISYERLEFELYRAELLNALDLERAVVEQNWRETQADLSKLRANVDARNISLIKTRADYMADIYDYRKQIIDFQAANMAKELTLAEAQLETAQERLKIIDSLKTIIKAEETILETEQRRLIILERIVDIEEEIANIKQGMIPYYLQLEDAREKQAKAIIAETYWRKLLVELGYTRTELRDAESSATVQIEEKQNELELARLEFMRASAAVELARAAFRTTLSQEKSTIQREIKDLRENIRKDEISLRLDTSLENLIIRLKDDINIEDKRQELTAEELTARLNALIDIANSRDTRIRDNAKTIVKSLSDRELYQTITAGDWE